MAGSYSPGRAWAPWSWPALAALVLVLGGCAAQEPPLTPAEAAFKQEVKEVILKLSPLLVEPVAKGSIAGINVALQKFFSDPQNEPKSCPLAVVVTDKDGVTLGKYPVGRGFGVDFSSYEVVRKVLQVGKTAQGRFFLQNGSRIFVVCAPLMRQEQVVGILALGGDANEIHRTCGLSEAKFLALDFNS